MGVRIRDDRHAERQLVNTGYCTVAQITRALEGDGDTQQAVFLQRFFKTGPGEYAEGDLFRGIRVPALRKLARKYRQLPQDQVLLLLRSKHHEDRLLALFILIHQYRAGDEENREAIFQQYLAHTRFVNNWDLVDSSAHQIVGDYLLDRSKGVLLELAGSAQLWERRIAIIATLRFIKDGRFDATLEIARNLLEDREDLIHKAVGWMLREVGKRDLRTEEQFLDRHYHTMPRTMLRYAIEKFPEPRRQAYLKGKI